jgi:NAD(P)-dependent dehydrogenase (short-subunit alcohol dehydrogenase family)
MASKEVGSMTNKIAVITGGSRGIGCRRDDRPGASGRRDDIGPMIAALLSDENRCVNGQRIEALGGFAL